MIIHINDLQTIRDKHSNEKIVLTSGTFDLFHVGHLNYLEQVKKYGDVLIVLLSGDQRVRARKGSKRPIISESNRARILDAIVLVDYVMIDPSKMNPNSIDPIHAHILDKLQPNFYVTDGPDPRFVDLMDKSKFIILDRINPLPSTTDTINEITRRYCQ